MSRGFVTIATGSEKYYKLAYNLLQSYKINNQNEKFALITDANNQFIDGYDDIIVLDKPNNSYLDKIDLLRNVPYDENIFIDADSLVYSNLSYLWELFKDRSDFSSFGYTLPLDAAKNCWFTYEGAGEFKKQIDYLVNFHGGIYFIRKGSYCENMHTLATYIKENYNSFQFWCFKTPADEPVLALAAAVKKANFVERLDGDVCFYPVAQKVKTHYKCGKPIGVTYTFKEENKEAVIIHFGNSNISKRLYRQEVCKMKSNLTLKKRYQFWLDDFKAELPQKQYIVKHKIYQICPQFIINLYRKVKESK